MKALRQHMKGKALFRGVEQGLEALVTDKAAYLDRFLDIQAALLWAQNQCSNPARYLIGHSMGAATLMLEAGAKNKLGLNTPAEKFDAYIAMSPQGVGSIFPAQAWHQINAPVLIMTGTQDKELGGLPWQTRTEPYEDMPAGCKWLGVIDGATHMSFAGRGRGKQEEALIVNTVLSFMRSSKDQSCIPPASPAGLELKNK
jgi:dienelactone hydrolase